MTGDRLTVAQVAALVGVRPGTWRSYVARGQAPAPAEHLDRRTPLWDRAAVEAWAGARRRAKPQERRGTDGASTRTGSRSTTEGGPR